MFDTITFFLLKIWSHIAENLAEGSLVQYSLPEEAIRSKFLVYVLFEKFCLCKGGMTIRQKVINFPIYKPGLTSETVCTDQL